MYKARVLPNILFFTLMLLVASLAGCSPFQSEEKEGGSENSEVLNYDLVADIADLNSLTTTDQVSFNVLNNVMEGLYRLDGNEVPQPAMAEGVEVSADGLSYTFTLRDGIEWSNGEPVTSRDFRYAWLRAMDPETASQYSFIIADYVEGGAEFNAGEAEADDVGIETPDERTLEVALTQPTPFFLSLTAFPTYLPLNQGFVEEQGDGFARSPEAILYNGPYTMTEFDPANGVVLRKNENYWDADNVDIEEVNARVIKETDTRVNLYESGELDFAVLTSEYVDEFRGSPEFFTATGFATGWVEMNREDPAMQNENIRRALQQGFDRQALAEVIFNDGSVPAEGFVPPGMPGPQGQTFREAAGPTAPAFEPALARELYERGVEELGEEPTIEILSDDVDESRAAATFIEAQLEENLGARVEINQQPLDSKIELQLSGEYQVALNSWQADYNDPMTFLDLYATGNPFNTIGFSNERYDALIDGAKMEADPRVRMDALIEAEALLLGEEATLAPAFHKGEAKLLKPRVRNYEEHPYGATVEFKYARIET